MFYTIQIVEGNFFMAQWTKGAMGKELRKIRHTFHSTNPLPFLVTCNIYYRACIIKVSKHNISNKSCKSFKLLTSQQQSPTISMQILQHDPIEPYFSNFDVRNWLKGRTPSAQACQKISCNPQIPQAIMMHKMLWWIIIIINSLH